MNSTGVASLHRVIKSICMSKAWLAVVIRPLIGQLPNYLFPLSKSVRADVINIHMSGVGFVNSPPA